MTPQALRNALDCLVNGVAPNLPSKPGRNAITSLLRAFIASRPAASPAASITTARRLLAEHAAFLPDPSLLAAVSQTATRLSAHTPVADPQSPWLDLLIQTRPSRAADTAITSRPANFRNNAHPAIRTLVAINSPTAPVTIDRPTSLHLASWWKYQDTSVAIWSHSAPKRTSRPSPLELPSLTALCTAVTSFHPDDARESSQVSPGIRAAISRATAAFSRTAPVSASRMPKPPFQDSIWVPWQPSWRFWRSETPATGPQIDNLPQHPTPLSIPSSLQDIDPPTPQTVHIPASLIDAGALSDAQFEAFIMATAMHQKPPTPGTADQPPSRHGFLLADATGSGKGRVLAAIIATAWGQGSRRAIWISANPDLIADARRDWTDINADPNLIQPLSQSIPDHDCILFASYASLRNPVTRTNVIAWLRQSGPADAPAPTIIFDESQSTASLTSQQATSARVIQHRIPNARVVYASATATTDTASWIFANRLALWNSPETCFRSPSDLIANLHPHGLSALQILFRHTASRGAAITRSLRLDDVPFEPLECPLTRKQHETQSNWAKAWRLAWLHWIQSYIDTRHAILKQKSGSTAQKSLQSINFESNSEIPSNAITALRQAFFRCLVTSFKSEPLIKAIEKDIADGHQCIIQIDSTLEAHATRAIQEYAEQEGWSPETGNALYLPDGFDLSPAHDIAIRCKKAFSIHKMEPDPHSDPRDPTLRVSVDENGKPIPSPQAIIARDAAFKALTRNFTPTPLLDHLVLHFGDRIAEVTGRSMRVERTAPDIYGRTMAVRSRTHADATEEAAQFQAGTRKILIFSSAGSTGRSYHDDIANPVPARRIHYVVQPAWNTATLIQGLGRTHRSNQRTTPVLRLVTTDLPGEIRYTAHANSRIQRMGASNRAHTKAQSSLRFDDLPRFDTKVARDALAELTTVATIYGLPGLPREDFVKATGIHRSTRHSIPFLNRLITLSPEHQKIIFDEFLKRYRTQEAEAELHGHTDKGIAGYKHPIVHSDPPVTYFSNHTLIPFHSYISTAANQPFHKNVVDAFEAILPSNHHKTFTTPIYYRTPPGDPGHMAAAIELPEAPWNPANPTPALILVTQSGVSLVRSTGRLPDNSPRIINPVTGTPFQLSATDPCPRPSNKKKHVDTTKISRSLRTLIGQLLHRYAWRSTHAFAGATAYTPRFMVYGDLLKDWKRLTQHSQLTGLPISCAAFQTQDGFQTGLVLSLADFLLLHHPTSEYTLPAIHGQLPSSPPQHMARNSNSRTRASASNPLFPTVIPSLTLARAAPGTAQTTLPTP